MHKYLRFSLISEIGELFNLERIATIIDPICPAQRALRKGIYLMNGHSLQILKVEE